MANADLSRLMDSLRVELPSALDDAIKHALFSVTDELLRTSELWKERISFPTVAGQTFYEIEPEESTCHIVRLVGVENNIGSPVLGTMEVIGELVFRFGTPANETWIAEVVLTVSDPTDSDGFPRIPRWIVDKYRETLIEGVLAKMMSQPAKVYSSERLAIFHGRRFRDLCAQARVDAQHKHLRGAQAWRYPRGWR